MLPKVTIIYGYTPKVMMKTQVYYTYLTLSEKKGATQLRTSLLELNLFLQIHV